MTTEAQKVWEMCNAYLIAAKKHLVDNSLRKTPAGQFDGDGEMRRVKFLFPDGTPTLHHSLWSLRVMRWALDSANPNYSAASHELKLSLKSFQLVQREILMAHYLAE